MLARHLAARRADFDLSETMSLLLPWHRSGVPTVEQGFEVFNPFFSELRYPQELTVGGVGEDDKLPLQEFVRKAGTVFIKDQIAEWTKSSSFSVWLPFGPGFPPGYLRSERSSNRTAVILAIAMKSVLKRRGPGSGGVSAFLVFLFTFK